MEPKNDCCQAQAPTQVESCCGRQSAHDVLHQMIEDHLRRAKQIHALNSALPLKLSTEADAALWDILMDARRR